MWAGRDALRLGLVDEIGGLEAAIAYAARKAGLGQEWMLVQTPHPKSLPEILLDYWGAEKKPVGQTGGASLLVSELRQELAALHALNDPMGCYVMLPYTLRVK